MALPDFTGWSVTHWYEASSHRIRQMIKMKDMLVATGHWYVVGSSDYTDGGRWNMSGLDYWPLESYVFSGNNGAEGVWCILQNDVLDIQISIQNTYGITDNDTNSSTVWRLSPGKNYAATADYWYRRPACSDEVSLISIESKPTIVNGSRRVDLWYKTDGSAFRMVHFGSNNGSFNNMLVLETASAPRAEVDHNFLAMFKNPTVAAWRAGTNNPVVEIDGTPVTVRMVSEGNTSGWLASISQFSSQLPDGEWPIQEAGYWFSELISKAGIFGKCDSWYFVSSNVASGTVMPSTGPATHIVYNNVVLPWDDYASWSL